MEAVEEQESPQTFSDDEDGRQTLSTAFQAYSQHDSEEKNHWDEVCRAYRQYATFAMCHWNNQKQRLAALPESQRLLLPPAFLEGTHEELARAQTYRDAAIRNQFCLDNILKHAGMPHSQQVGSINSTASIVSSNDEISKVSSVLKSLARDWSEDGAPERAMAFEPILNNVRAFVPIVEGQDVPRICVPGAGVGRLALELVNQGYGVQGNEFSLFMLLASDFILNSGICTPDQPLAISPWLLESRNVHATEDPVRKVLIPDVDPSSVLSGDGQKVQVDFSMAAGDFLSLYKHPREEGAWDAVVCCFFMDATPNIIECLQTIHRMLKDGGVLINFGPLLYHWSGPAMRPDDGTIQNYQARCAYLDKRYMQSVDLCWEDVRQVMVNVGFEFLKEQVGNRSLYTADRKSMMNMAYRCIDFVARKKAPSDM